MHAMLSSSARLWAGAILATLTLPALARHYTIEDLGTDETPAAINEAGAIAGSGAVHGYYQAAVYRGEHWRTIGPNYSQTFGINQQGDVVGYLSFQATLWPRTGSPVELPAPQETDSATAFAINGNGTVVGNYYTFPAEAFHCFAWRQDRGSFDLGLMGDSWGDCTAVGINNANQAVGTASNPNGEERAFRYDEQDGFFDLGTLPGGTWSYGFAIDEGGDVVGQSGISPDQSRNGFAFAYVEQQHQMFALDPHRRYPASVARAINNRGDIVGQVWVGGVLYYAVRFGPNIVHLEDELVDRGDWHLVDAIATSDNGRIVGLGTRSDGRTPVYRLTPTGK